MTAASGMRDPLLVDRLCVQLGEFRLDEISFRIEPGQVTALLGHNGAGKTTTLRMIMGIVRKDSGRINLGGLDHLRDEKTFKRHIGFVPEESFLYNGMTAVEFVGFASGFYDDWKPESARRLMQTFDLPPGKRIGQLSKGMRAKISLVVALSHDPSVLLLDEPTSGLDPRSRVETLKLLQEAAHEEGRAVLFSTHNLHEVDRIADHVIIVDHGRIVADEDLAVLRRTARTPWTLENYYLELVQ